MQAHIDILTAVLLKIQIFWDLPYQPVNSCYCCKGA